MATIDGLISNAENRASNYANTTDFLVAELRGFVKDAGIDVVFPTDIELSNFTVPGYISPVQAATATPNYEEPTQTLPASPVLAGIGAIDRPAARAEPVLNTTGLFQHVLPTSNLPSFDETAPNLRVDELVAELDALVTPSISNLVFPEVHTFSLGAAPTVTLPTFDAPANPDALRDPEAYGAIFEAAYARMAPEMQAFVDDKLATWMTDYAPEYSAWIAQLETKITAGMDGGALPDQFEAAMFTRAQGRVQEEFESANTQVFKQFERSGFMEPPGVLNSNLLQLRLKNAAALANQSTDIYVERRKSEVQHAQFSMSLASGQITAVRNTAIAYAQMVGESMSRASQYANSLSGHVEKIFDHLVARSNLAIAILNTINAQYEVKRKAALAAYDGYRLALDAEKVRTELDLAKIQQLEAQIRAEGLNITKYSAIVDAVTKKGSLEELKNKEYSIRADIFSNKIKAQLASYDVYRAAMDGDKSKLDGELSKIKVFETLINMDTVQLDAQVKQVNAIVASNDAQTQIFKSGADVYRLGLDSAIQKFSAQAEVKKLAQSLYGQELTNAIEQFKAGLEIPKLMMDAIIKQYQARMQGAVEQARIEVEQLRIAEQASISGVNAYQAMASSALGSLNTVASSAISAAA